MSSTSNLSFPVRFYHGGQITSLQCEPSQTFGQIKDRIWSKKNLPANEKADYIFRLPLAELTLDDSDYFFRFLEMVSVFRESGSFFLPSTSPSTSSSSSSSSQPSTYLFECFLMPKKNLFDQPERDSKKLSATQVYQQRALLKCKIGGLLGSSIKNRYCVIKDMTLFAFESEEQFTKEKQVHDIIQLGNCFCTRIEGNTSESAKYPFGFELKYIVPEKYKDVAITQFYVDDEKTLNEWINLINAIYIRRMKYIIVTIIEELERRNNGNTIKVEGIFRVSGSKADVENLLVEYDKDRIVQLSSIPSEHTLTGALKQSLRSFPDPLLTFDLYDSFLKSGSTDNVATRISIQKQLISDKLPVTNLGLLAYLISFLSRVSKHSDLNKMLPSNLAIVFAPNILKPLKENVNSVMLGSSSVNNVVENMILNVNEVFEEKILLHSKCSKLPPTQEDISKLAAILPQHTPSSTAASTPSNASSTPTASGPNASAAAAPASTGAAPPPLPNAASFSEPPPLLSSVGAAAPPPLLSSVGTTSTTATPTQSAHTLPPPLPISNSSSSLASSPPPLPTTPNAGTNSGDSTPAADSATPTPVQHKSPAAYGGVALIPPGAFVLPKRENLNPTSSGGPPPLPATTASKPPPLPISTSTPPSTLSSPVNQASSTTTSTPPTPAPSVAATPMARTAPPPLPVPGAGPPPLPVNTTPVKRHSHSQSAPPPLLSQTLGGAPLVAPSPSSASHAESSHQSIPALAVPGVEEEEEEVVESVSTAPIAAAPVAAAPAAAAAAAAAASSSSTVAPVSPVPEVNEVPQELLALQQKCRAMTYNWSHSLAPAQSSMDASLTALITAHTNARKTRDGDRIEESFFKAEAETEHIKMVLENLQNNMNDIVKHYRELELFVKQQTNALNGSNNQS